MSVLLFALDSLGELARAEVEGLAAAVLERAARWKQEIAARARRTSEEIAAASGDIADVAEAAVAIPLGLALYLVDPEHGVARDLGDLLSRLRRSDGA